MITDFAMPNSNEKKFVKLATRLGYKKLCFVYKYEKKLTSKEIEAKLSKINLENVKLQIDYALLVDNAKDIHKARSITNNIIFHATPESNVRNISEKYKPKIITNLEFQKHDFVHHRSSGTNQVICNAMKQNSIYVGLSFSLLMSTKYKPEILGRMMQNISLAKKYKIPIKIFTLSKTPYQMKGYKDLVSLLLTLNATEKQTKEAFEF